MSCSCRAAQALERVRDRVEGLDHLRLELGLDGGERKRILHVVFVVIALGRGLARILLLAVPGGGITRRLEWRGGRRRRGRRRRLHDLEMRCAGNRRADGLRNRLAIGTDDHRHLHLLGVGTGVGRLKVDDVAEEDFSFVELVAPDDDGLEGQRAFAEARDHRFAAGLDALGNGDFAFAREQLDRAHLAQVHAHGVVGAFGRLFLFGGRQRLRLGLDDFRAGILVVVVGFLGRLFAVFGIGVFGLDHVDAHLIEHRVDVLDLVGGHFARGHDFVDLVDGDVAALLGGLDHLLDAGIGEIEKRQRRIGRAFFLLRGWFFFFCLGRLCLARHSASPGPSWPSTPARRALSAHGQKGPRRRGAAPNQVTQSLRNPLSSD